MTYQELESINDTWDGVVCLFGAGAIGKTWGYDIVKAAGFDIECYLDNNASVGSVIRDQKRVCSILDVKKISKPVLFFVTTSEKIHRQIEAQLIEEGFKNIIFMGDDCFHEIYYSLENADESTRNRYRDILDDKIYLQKQFELRVGYKLDLTYPHTFNEKLQWLKIYDRHPEYVMMVDKYLAKEYVAKIVGNQYIIPTLGVWNDPEEIDFEKLPEQFVLKCNHTSSTGICICEDKSNFDIQKAKRELKKALNQDFYIFVREWPYKNVSRKIIAEEYIDTGGEDLLDYKLLCFNGKVKCSFVVSERKTGLKCDFYDAQWNWMPFSRHYPNSSRKFDKPQHYKEMVHIAEKLAAKIPFLRVDFYETPKGLKFGELTFYPGGGFEEFDPVQYDKILGDWLELPELN